MQAKSKSQSNSMFSPEFGDCPTHGRYPLNMLGEGGIIFRYLEVCPSCRRQERAQTLLKNCNIPPRFADCTFDNYEADSPDKRRVLERCQEYAKQFRLRRSMGACLILSGRPGTGKNHLTTAITKVLVAQRFTVLRVKATEFLDAYWARSFEDRTRWVQDLARVDLLIADEIGRSSNAKAAQDAFFRLIDARYEQRLPTMLTTNLGRDELCEVLGEAGFDRLTQGGGVWLNLNWESARSKVGVTP